MTATPPPLPPRQRQFPCRNCGAALHFEPGTTCLKCPYCGTENQIEQRREVIEELDYHATLAALERSEPSEETLTVRCPSCGAETSMAPNVTAGKCPFCATPIVAGAMSRRQLKPRSLLPFHITQKQADEAFQRWIQSLWFAPSNLKRMAEKRHLTGVYLPAWTYDANTESDYTGQRGDDYWDTEPYTVHVHGRTERRTRRVRKTRWRSVSGRVWNEFDDVLVMASRSLPPKFADALQPWDLGNLVPYQPEFLSGFVAESYQIDLEQGFGLATQVMDGTIRQTIRRDIGGDHQRIHSVDTRYFDITFKHILLPAWISAYQYQQRVFRFVVNARTGEVQGERPYSWIKITLFVLMIVSMLLLIFAVVQS